MVEQTAENGVLTRLKLETHLLSGSGFTTHAIFLKDQPPEPVGRWLSIS